MRVLQLTCHYYPNLGGVETHLNDLVIGLIKKNNNVFVLCYRPLMVKVKWKVYEKGNNLKIIRIPWLPGFFYKFVKNPIVEFLYLTPGLFITTPFVILIFNPDVIQAHGLIAGFVGTFWGKVFGKRIVNTTHSIYNFPPNGLYHNFARWIFKNSDKVLTLSKQSKIEIATLGIEDKKVTVFTYWIDLNKFKPIKNAKRIVGWENIFVVLFVGRLIEEKGILILLDAAKEWNKKITLVIIGTGPLELTIKKRTLKKGNIKFLGIIDNQKLPIYYSASDLTIVPSIHEEGFGRVILESLACGTPVIGSNRGAIPEAMDSSVGTLIKVTDLEIKRIIEGYFNDKNKLFNHGKRARKYAVEKYNEKNINNIISTYKV
jgi:glycosyltransferase involved in cell wall biosynthesis